MSRCVYKWWGYIKRVCAVYHKTQQQRTNTAAELRELRAVDAALAEVTDQDERRIIGRYLDGEKLEPIAEAEGRTLGGD